jgi:hypothetical protein
LDAWVRRSRERYPQKKAQWLSQISEEGKSKKKAKQGGEAGDGGSGPKQPDVSKYDVAGLKTKLAEAGMPEDMLALFSDADIVENARSMGLLDEKPEEAK